MIKDLRYALRLLLRAPGFAAVAVLTLAVGIGANTAIFSLIDQIFLRGLTFERPADLYHLTGNAPERNLTGVPMSITKFEHIRDHQSVFTAVGSDLFNAFTLTGFGDPAQVNGYQITSNYFDLVGAKPILGRTFRTDEERDARVVLVSEAFWTTRLNRDEHALGRTLTLDGVPYEIVGVMPAQPLAFFGPVDVWTTHPMEFPGITPELRARGFSFLRVIARIKPGVTAAQARQELDALAASYKAANGEKADSTWNLAMAALPEDTFGGLKDTFWMLVGAVAFVLLIASSNVANLLLARFVGRRREVALRLALGAERRRVIRLFLIESVTVSLAAAAVGMLLARLGLKWLLSSNTPLPIAQTVELEPIVLAFTVGVAMVTGIVMGLYPAFQAARGNLADVLNEGGRSNTGSRRQHWVRMSLLGGQVVLSFVLLVGAFLLLTSFRKLAEQAPGFSPDEVMLSTITLPASRYPDKLAQGAFQNALLDELRHTPGITHAAMGIGMPLAGFGVGGPYSKTGAEFVPYPKRPLAPMRFITPDYFATLGIPILQGREFTTDDTAERPMVILISERSAATLFPHENALGRHLLVGSVNQGQDAEIVGIAGDVRSGSLAATAPIEIYRPMAQRPGSANGFSFAVRVASGDPAAIVPTVRAVLRRFDADLPLIGPAAYSTVVGGSIAPQRLLIAMLGLFAGLALLMAVVGIYSVVAYLVGQRTSEIGVRLALGAEPRDVVGLMLRQGLAPVLVGLVIGALAALGVGHLLQSQLFGTSGFDPLSFAITAAALFVTASLACWIPARRAARVAPSLAIRA
jgi:predicted permease